MEINQLTEQLAALTGFLQSSSADDEKNVEALQASIAESILQQDLSTVRSKEFIFERSDLFLTSSMAEKKSSILVISKFF